MPEGNTKNTPTTPEEKSWKQSLPQRDEIVPGGRRYTFSFHGNWDELHTEFNNLIVGLKQDFLGLNGTVCSGRIDREPGDRSLTTVVFVHPEKVEYWASDFSEVQKPVKTWKADDADDPPNLEQISRWEGLQSSDWASYCGYLWDGSTKMAGNTLKLAQMIHEWGISYYSIAAPVAMRSTTWDHYPDDAGKGMYQETTELTNRSGWIDTGPEGNITVLKVDALSEVWFKNKDQITPNADGTFSRVEQWLGVDKVNKDLYPDPETPNEGTK